MEKEDRIYFLREEYGGLWDAGIVGSRGFCESVGEEGEVPVEVLAIHRINSPEKPPEDYQLGESRIRRKY